VSDETRRDETQRKVRRDEDERDRERERERETEITYIYLFSSKRKRSCSRTYTLALRGLVGLDAVASQNEWRRLPSPTLQIPKKDNMHLGQALHSEPDTSAQLPGAGHAASFLRLYCFARA
jgi:hypothetical protein